MFNAETNTTSPAYTASTSASSQPGAETQTIYPFRLLKDEVVLGTFPIAQKSRPLGKLVSFLFVTDSRVIYSAEAKSFTSSSTHMKEYQVSTIKGVEVGRHRGFDAVSASAAIGVVLNFIVMLVLASALNTGFGSNYSNNPFGAVAYSDNPFGVISSIFVFLAFASLIVGIVTVFVMRRPKADISVVGPEPTRQIAQERNDLPIRFLTVLLFLASGLFICLVIIAWTILRELGIFKAEDAQSFADTHNIDRISYEVGALILDVQARGKLAGK